ncbi:MAG: hypothetical protein K1X75_14250 [Leptospirales bacterium]|nr:hypothetical protein [Leptospirales bacterium]
MHRFQESYYVRERIHWISDCDYDLILEDSNFPGLAPQHQIGRTTHQRITNPGADQYEEAHITPLGAEPTGCVEILIRPLTEEEQRAQT